MWPNEPTFFAYGNSGSSYVQCWQATVDPSGVLSAFTSVGTTTTWPKSGTSFYIQNPRAVTDRWALGDTVSTLCLRYDRLNPLATTNIFSAFPPMAAGENSNSQTLVMDSQAAPGHVLSIRGPYVSPTFRNHVLDLLLSDDGSSFTTVGDWTAPGTPTWTAAGFSAQGKAVAYTIDGSGTRTGYYDIFGENIEFPVAVALSVANQWVVPTNPVQPDPPLPVTYDAWLIGGYSTPYEMGVMTDPAVSITGVVGTPRTTFIPARSASN